MKTLLYVCAHNPYPARSGGQVDIWNRLQALRQLGVAVDLVLTVKKPPLQEEIEVLEATVRRLLLVKRRPLAAGLIGRLPLQMAVRSPLRTVNLGQRSYDVALLDNEFCGAVLQNPTFSAKRVAIRVQNDEAAYQRKLAETTPSVVRRAYFRMEARRMSHCIPQLWKKVDALWFISFDELKKFEAEMASADRGARGRREVQGSFLPAGVNLSLAGKPPLTSRSILFVGTLSVALNQDAVRWYLQAVHPLLLDEPGYEFVIAGSTMGKNVAEFCREVQAVERVRVHCDVPDLQPLFAASAGFVSPMRFGAGVKLKTVEAALRGLPLVTTTVGAEGSGLLDRVHCRIADEPEDFALAVRCLLREPEEAARMRDRAAEFICASYNQTESLRRSLAALDTTV